MVMKIKASGLQIYKCMSLLMCMQNIYCIKIKDIIILYHWNSVLYELNERHVLCSYTIYYLNYINHKVLPGS